MLEGVDLCRRAGLYLDADDAPVSFGEDEVDFAALAISKVGEGRSSAAGASPVSVTYALGVLIIRVLRLVDQTGRLAVRNTISR
jgi:hypothetical protein